MDAEGKNVSLHGLTDPLRDEYKKDDTHVLVGNKFLSLLRTENRVSCGTSLKINNSVSSAEFLIKIKHHLNNYLLDVPKFSVVSIFAINSYDKKKKKHRGNLSDASNSICCEWNNMALDINESKLFKPPISKAKRNSATNIGKMSFLKKVQNLSMNPYFL